MKDCLEIRFKKNEVEGLATVKYKLNSKFSNEPIYVGQSTIKMFAMTGAIDWGCVLSTLDGILSVYIDTPKMENTFLSNIDLDIQIEGYTASELFGSYKKYQAIMGQFKVASQVESFIYKCDKHHFIPTINDTDLVSILPTV